jgi:hypothetical protein
MFRKSIVVLAISVVAFTCHTAHAAQTISTRFGQLKTDEYDIELSYKGKAIAQGNSSIRFVKKFQIGESDVLLMQDNGGTACPALYMFVTVTASGTKVSEEFGSCNEVANIAQEGESINITMPGYLMVNGLYKQSGEKTKCSFSFKAGVVSKAANKLCTSR